MSTRARGRAPRLRLGLAALVVVGAAACGGRAGAESSAGEATRERGVAVEGLAFDPERTTIAAGTTVTWTNMDPVAHTITSGTKGTGGVPGVSKGKPDEADGMFDGDVDENATTFSFTFEKAGTYAYFCRIHGGMTGVVVVK
jgi:plastocyanin